MDDLRSRLIELVAAHVSPIIARGIVTRALEEHPGDPEKLNRDDLRALRSRLEAAVRMFVDAAPAPQLKRSSISEEILNRDHQTE